MGHPVAILLGYIYQGGGFNNINTYTPRSSHNFVSLNFYSHIYPEVIISGKGENPSPANNKLFFMLANAVCLSIYLSLYKQLMQVHSNLSLVNSTYLYFVLNSHRVVFIVRGQTCLVIATSGWSGYSLGCWTFYCPKNMFLVFASKDYMYMYFRIQIRFYTIFGPPPPSYQFCTFFYFILG